MPCISSLSSAPSGAGLRARPSARLHRRPVPTSAVAWRSRSRSASNFSPSRSSSSSVACASREREPISSAAWRICCRLPSGAVIASEVCLASATLASRPFIRSSSCSKLLVHSSNVPTTLPSFSERRVTSSALMRKSSSVRAVRASTGDAPLICSSIERAAAFLAGLLDQYPQVVLCLLALAAVLEDRVKHLGSRSGGLWGPRVRRMSQRG